MALVTGQEVKMVRCSTQAQYNDITPKDGATLYWIVETKKIVLDGTEYGFNSDDVTAALLGSLINTNQGVGDTVDLSKSVEGNQLRIRGNVNLATDADQMITNGADGIVVKAIEIENMIGLTIANVVESKYGAANGIATLDGAGKVPSGQLPSYVDDVREYASVSAFPSTGESGVIYVAIDTNRTYRWSGSGYVEISASLALGETSSTAYRGDRGKTAYDHSQITDGNPHGTDKTDVGLGSVENFGVATQAEAQAGTAANKYMTPQRTAQAISSLAPKLTWTVIS